MLARETIKSDTPPLQFHDWPPVPTFEKFPPEIAQYLAADNATRRQMMETRRGDHEAHGALINKGLGVVYAYLYGYADSPCYLKSNPELEMALSTAKILLEEEMINCWLPKIPIPQVANQVELVEYLADFISNETINPGIHHEFWNYIRDEAGEKAMRQFLRLVLCRTEVVDDECAYLLVGLQGNMKKVMASNLWDECGNGQLTRFHTYWLRRLMEATQDWEGLPTYRGADLKPWSSGVLSNMFNVLLTRSCYKLRAYGCFLITESWVEPHFMDVLHGLNRVGLTDEEISVYFRAHIKIDPNHTRELLDALRYQTPALKQQEIDEILYGAHLALGGALWQYRGVLKHLRGIDKASANSSNEPRTAALVT